MATHDAQEPYMTAENSMQESPRAPWPNDALEHLGRCPICACESRELLYSGLTDRMFGAPGEWSMYRCSKCNTGYLDPRPNKETIALAYSNYGTHESENAPARSWLRRTAERIRNGYLNRKYGHTASPSANWGAWAMYLMPPPIRWEWDAFARHLPKPGSRRRLLDVGCGNGAFLARARSAGWEVQGLDLDPEGARLAREKDLDVRVGNYCSMHIPENTFDVITTNQVFEHVHEPLEFLATLKRWLAPGGTLWLGTPNISSYLHETFGRDWYLLHPPQHLFLVSPETLVDLLKKAGFEDVALKPRGFSELSFATVSRRLQNGARPFAVHRDDARFTTVAKGLLAELAAALCWRRESEVIVVARKPTVSGQA